MGLRERVGVVTPMIQPHPRRAGRRPRGCESRRAGQDRPVDPVEPPPPYGAGSPHGPAQEGPPPTPTDEIGLFAAWRIAAKSTARASAKASNATRRTVRRATNAQGAGESGM